jgi:hypothetical protein
MVLLLNFDVGVLTLRLGVPNIKVIKFIPQRYKQYFNSPNGWGNILMVPIKKYRASYF